jgi:hypothetical protein
MSQVLFHENAPSVLAKVGAARCADARPGSQWFHLHSDQRFATRSRLPSYDPDAQNIA